MRFLLRSFILLDAISLIIIGMHLWVIIEFYDKLSTQSEKLKAILMFPMFILLLIGAIGLFYKKKFGFILYYIQFPFRLYLWIFSIGFITGIPEALSIYDDNLVEILFKLCFVAEFMRLYLTIKMQLNKH